MSRFETTMSASYFDALYAENNDPWQFASSPYEREKYAATLSALPRAHYRSALEVGCSIGVLTRKLAMHADALCAIDLASQALDGARRRCADLAHVRFECMGVPLQWPHGCFDLIVLSEVVYYLDRADVRALAARVGDTLAAGGDVVLVHWLGETHYPLSADEAVDLFTAATVARAFRVTGKVRTVDYRLDVLRAST